MTNYERIKSMTIEEIGDFILSINLSFDPWCDRHCFDFAEENCNDCLGRWLEAEVEE